jgi:hypothetical protein
MRRRNGATCVLVCAGLVAEVLGCSKPGYIPNIRVVQSSRIIEATVEFHDVYSAQALVSGTASFGLIEPNTAKVAPSVLTKQVGQALRTSFDQARVFSKLVTFDPHPDLVLTARINSLHEHHRPQIWTKLPYVGTIATVLDLKTHVSSGEADLTVFLLTSVGKAVGVYRGSSSFNERFHTTGEMSPGTRLNRALSEAVQEIQSQILNDARLRTVAAREERE